MSVVLSSLRVSDLRRLVPVPHSIGLFKPLYAHVQVRCPARFNYSFLMFVHSSIITGSSSHKLVTSDVSRILWLYYNDRVSTGFSFCGCMSYHIKAHTLPGLRWERAILRCALSCQMDRHADNTFASSEHPIFPCWDDLSAIGRLAERSRLHPEEHHQSCSAMEGI